VGVGLGDGIPATMAIQTNKTAKITVTRAIVKARNAGRQFSVEVRRNANVTRRERRCEVGPLKSHYDQGAFSDLGTADMANWGAWTLKA
jgi:hypothetical protein